MEDSNISLPENMPKTLEWLKRVAILTSIGVRNVTENAETNVKSITSPITNTLVDITEGMFDVFGWE